MVFNSAQLNNFFTQAGQMALTNAQRGALADEGLTDVTDFDEGFDEDTLKEAFKNTRSCLLYTSDAADE